MCQGTDAITDVGRGDGSFTSRSMEGSKRKYIVTPTDEGLRRQFYSKTPHVIARRRDVALLWEDGASPLEILKLINEDLVFKQEQAERLGLEQHKLKPVTMSTIRNDLKLVKRQAREDAEYASVMAATRIINHVDESLTWARQLYREAASFDQRAKALQVGDNVLRTFAKIMGGVPDLRVDVRTESKQEIRVIDGAPPNVVMARQQKMIDAHAELLSES